MHINIVKFHVAHVKMRDLFLNTRHILQFEILLSSFFKKVKVAPYPCTNSSYHALHVYYTPGTVLSPLHTYLRSNLHSNFMQFSIREISSARPSEPSLLVWMRKYQDKFFNVI